MSTCGSCKHWAHPDGWGPNASLEYLRSTPRQLDENNQVIWHDDEDQAREELAHQIEAQFGLCGGVQFGLEISSPDEAPPLAFTIDGSMFMAALWTRAEFGCALFKEQEG